ncbi:hypothetical protein [Mariniluteicoccus endophyticus]
METPETKPNWTRYLKSWWALLALLVALVVLAVPVVLFVTNPERAVVIRHLEAIEKANAKKAIAQCTDAPGPLLTDDVLRRQRSVNLGIGLFEVEAPKKVDGKSLVTARWKLLDVPHEETFVVNGGRIENCTRKLEGLSPANLVNIHALPLPDDTRVFAGSYHVGAQHPLLGLAANGENPARVRVVATDAMRPMTVGVLRDQIPAIGRALATEAATCTAAGTCPALPAGTEIVGVDDAATPTIREVRDKRLLLDVPVRTRTVGQAGTRTIAAWLTVANGKVVAADLH